MCLNTVKRVFTSYMLLPCCSWPPRTRMQDGQNPMRFSCVSSQLLKIEHPTVTYLQAGSCYLGPSHAYSVMSGRAS